MEKKETIQIDYANLAMPEIHTGKEDGKEHKKNNKDIIYDSVAIPEIHIRKKH